MALPEQKKQLLKAKWLLLSVMNWNSSQKEEINQVFLVSRVMYKAVLGLHFRCQEQKRNGQSSSYTTIHLCLSATREFPHKIRPSISERTPWIRWVGCVKIFTDTISDATSEKRASRRISVYQGKGYVGSMAT